MLRQRHTLVVRDQVKVLFICFPKNRKKIDLIHEENHVIDTSEIKEIKTRLKKSKHAYVRFEHLRWTKIIVELWRCIKKMLRVSEY